MAGRYYLVCETLNERKVLFEPKGRLGKGSSLRPSVLRVLVGAVGAEQPTRPISGATPLKPSQAFSSTDHS